MKTATDSGAAPGRRARSVGVVMLMYAGGPTTAVALNDTEASLPTDATTSYEPGFLGNIHCSAAVPSGPVTAVAVTAPSNETRTPATGLPDPSRTITVGGLATVAPTMPPWSTTE